MGEEGCCSHRHSLCPQQRVGERSHRAQVEGATGEAGGRATGQRKTPPACLEPAMEGASYQGRLLRGGGPELPGEHQGAPSQGRAFAAVMAAAPGGPGLQGHRTLRRLPLPVLRPGLLNWIMGLPDAVAARAGTSGPRDARLSASWTPGPREAVRGQRPDRSGFRPQLCRESSGATMTRLLGSMLQNTSSSWDSCVFIKIATLLTKRGSLRPILPKVKNNPNEVDD